MKTRRISKLWPSAILAMLTACTPALAPPVAAPPPTVAPLTTQLEQIFADPAFTTARWGVDIRSLDTGERIFAQDAERLALPASNLKLLTAAAALETLGPDFQFRTSLIAGGTVRNGVLGGPLVVVGTGDPTFSSRFFADPRDPFRAWADSLRALGITRIAGGIVAVDTAFSGPTVGAGWMWDDLAGADAAEFGALQFNEGVTQIDIFPGSVELEPGLIVLTPPTQYVRIFNDTRTMPAGSFTAIRTVRDDEAPLISIIGEVARDTAGVTRTVAVRNPSLYAISVIRETLRESGISIDGPAQHYTSLERDSPELLGTVPLFVHRSPPLRDILAGMMKTSQNLLAETLLRTVGHDVRGEGSATAGIEAVDSLLAAWQLPHRQMRMVDGSGMSRYDLVSPALLVDLLEHMDSSPYRADWLAALPVGGRDGTLANRMRDPPLFEHVNAKTGTLSGVRTLSGYLTTSRGERVVFSIMVTNHMQSGAAADRVAEEALRLVAEAR